jgi:hypothetical protein
MLLSTDPLVGRLGTAAIENLLATPARVALGVQAGPATDDGDPSRERGLDVRGRY